MSTNRANQISIFLDWPNMSENVNLTLERFCASRNDASMHGWTNYWEQTSCGPSVAWNTSIDRVPDNAQVSSPVWHQSKSLYSTTGVTNLTFTHPGLFSLKIEVLENTSERLLPISYHGVRLFQPHPPDPVEVLRAKPKVPCWQQPLHLR